jgi:chromosome segregation ATPase
VGKKAWLWFVTHNLGEGERLSGTQISRWMFINNMSQRRSIMKSAEDKLKSAKDKVEDKLASAKDKYVEKRKAEIDKWNVELENLEAKITAAGVDAKAKLAHEEHIHALRQKRDEARAKLAEIQAAGDDTWEDLKDGLEHTWTAVKDGFEKVKSRFK